MWSNIRARLNRVISGGKPYHPEIDGLRFLAVTMVVLFHIHGYFLEKNRIEGRMVRYKPDSEYLLPVINTGDTKFNFRDDPSNYRLLNAITLGGDRGVEFFFVISGFILCLPVAKYHIGGGEKVNLNRYYLRRLTRLVPPYVIAITAIFLLQLVSGINNAHLGLWQRTCHYFSTITYSYCYIYHRKNIFTAVTWSMEMEIQFYLVAPLLFRLLYWRPALRRVILLTGIAGFVIAQHYYHAPFLNIYRFMQFFLMGILLADLYVSKTAPGLVNSKWAVPACALIFVALLLLPIKVAFPAKLLFPFLIGGFYFLVLGNDILKRIISWKFMPVIGGMCYSIYLLHYTILSVTGRYTTKIRVSDYYLPNLFFQFIVIGIAVLIVSTLFYLIVEQPFMDKKWVNMLMSEKEDQTGHS